MEFLSYFYVLFEEDNVFFSLNTMLWLAEGLPSDQGGFAIPGFDLMITLSLIFNIVGIITILIHKKKK